MRKATLLLMAIACLAASAQATERRLYNSGEEVLLWLGNETPAPIPALPLPAQHKNGWQKAVTVALYPFTPYRRDTEDRVMNWLNAGYVSVGYYDLYTTFRALNASPTIRETSPIFGTYFTGRPHPAAAFAVHTGVNYAFLSGIRYAHNWVHDQNSQKQGKWKRTGEYVLWGLVVGLTIDRGRVANNNLKLARKYGK